MGARQSKRSVDISSTPKKGDLENGGVTTEEKLEKIEEGDSIAAKVTNNGSTTTTSTVTAEQQEAAATVTESGDAAATESTPSKTAASETETEATAEKVASPEEVSTPTKTTSEENKQESSPASPSETATPEEGGSEKKKKPKKKWSFRSFSFSKKDKQKPASKDEKQQETVPEGNENSQATENPPQAEQVTPEVPAVATVQNAQNEEPPPLPTSAPPTPADEVSVAPVVEKEETPTISEGDVEASGGGEGLAEPLEEAELEETTTTTTTTTITTAPVAPVVEPVTPLTNGTNGVVEMNGKHTEDEESISPVCERKPSVDSVTAKIGSLKLQIATDNVETPAQNGVEEPVEMNGIAEKCDSSLDKAVVEN